LARLDVVVASLHSKLRMDEDAMTERMLAAIANSHMDVLGHCTGRIVVGRGRPESAFDAARVFAACAEGGKAIEINSRPEPGQLEWQANGCERAAQCGIQPASVVNAWELDALLAGSASHAAASS
jgi:putative hydrolase